MKSRQWMVAIVAAMVYVLFDSKQALAWGPGTHTALGLQMLTQAAWLPAAVAAAITRFSIDFLYGNLAADVVFAKRLSKVKQFCHHWSTGFALLDRAQTERSRAFAYGYLSHLAADTVAHGKYIPYQVAATGTTVNFGHLYWELRADSLCDPRVWPTTEKVLRIKHEPHHGELRSLLTRTFLPYGANRQLFEGVNWLVLRPTWRHAVSAWDRWSRHDLPADLLSSYHSECLDRIQCLLTRERESPLLHEDPNGTAALAYVGEQRRQIRRMKRRGYFDPNRACEAAASHAPGLWLPMSNGDASETAQREPIMHPGQVPALAGN
jgi:hypothetical protein